MKTRREITLEQITEEVATASIDKCGKLLNSQQLTTIAAIVASIASRDSYCKNVTTDECKPYVLRLANNRFESDAANRSGETGRESQK